jgi:hypothetical protein
MTLFSDEACNASLAMRYGASRGSLAPDTLEVALFAGDPRADGVEMDAVGGYAAAEVPNDGTTWPDAPDARTIISAPIAFTATGAWTADGDPASATHWLIRDADTGDWWDTMPIDEPILVLDADDDFSLQLVVNYVPVVAVA